MAWAHESCPVQTSVHAYDGNIDSCIRHISNYIKLIELQSSIDEVIETWWDDFGTDDTLSARLALDCLKQFSLKHMKEVIEE